jgi:hypothetical protein
LAAGAFLILLNVAGCAPYRSAYVVAEGDLAGFTKAEVPLSFGGHDGRYAVVRPVIQSRGFDLMLDTGAGQGTVTLAPAALESLDVSYTGKTLTLRDAEGNKYRPREFVIPSIRLGDLELTNVPGYENLTSPPGFDGSIGLGLLGNFNVLIDYPVRAMTLYPKGTVPDFLSSEEWYRCEYAGGQQFDVRFAGLAGEYSLGLDTGSGATAIPADSDLARDIIEFYGVAAEKVTVNQRTGEEVYIYNMDLYLDEYALGEHDCVITDMAGYMGNGLMGYDFFNRNRVFAAFDSKTFWLNKTE